MSCHLSNYLSRNLQRSLLSEWHSNIVTVNFSICKLLNQWQSWWLESPPSLSFYPHIQNHLDACGLIQFTKLCSPSYQPEGYAAHLEQQQSSSFPLAKFLLTCICHWTTLSCSPPFFFYSDCCSPAGVMAIPKASSPKATQCSSAPPWRTAGTPAQRGPGAASMASAGHGKATTSSGMQERPLTPTETLLIVKGRTHHLIAFSWQGLVLPDGFKAWEHRRKPISAAIHVGDTSHS